MVKRGPTRRASREPPVHAESPCAPAGGSRTVAVRFHRPCRGGIRVGCRSGGSRSFLASPPANTISTESGQEARKMGAGERGLPARRIRHLAGYRRVWLSREGAFSLKVRVSLPGRMPERTGWKPALPRASPLCFLAFVCENRIILKDGGAIIRRVGIWRTRLGVVRWRGGCRRG